ADGHPIRRSASTPTGPKKSSAERDLIPRQDRRDLKNLSSASILMTWPELESASGRQSGKRQITTIAIESCIQTARSERSTSSATLFSARPATLSNTSGP